MLWAVQTDSEIGQELLRGRKNKVSFSLLHTSMTIVAPV